MTDAPDFLWAWVSEVFINEDKTPGLLRQWWTEPPTDNSLAGTAYVRRDPAVLAELPEVKALVAAACNKTIERAQDGLFLIPAAALLLANLAALIAKAQPACADTTTRP